MFIFQSRQWVYLITSLTKNNARSHTHHFIFICGIGIKIKMFKKRKEFILVSMSFHATKFSTQSRFPSANKQINKNTRFVSHNWSLVKVVGRNLMNVIILALMKTKTKPITKHFEYLQTKEQILVYIMGERTSKKPNYTPKTWIIPKWKIQKQKQNKILILETHKTSLVVVCFSQDVFLIKNNFVFLL